MSRLTVILVIVVFLGAFAALVIFDPFGFLAATPFEHASEVQIGTGSFNAWNELGSRSASVMYDSREGVFKMWYVGFGKLDRTGVGYATSGNGTDWDTSAYLEPVVEQILADPGASRPRTWEDGGITTVEVIRDGALYRMWYTAVEDTEERRERIGYATSTDGITWAKHSGNPVFTPQEGSWDAHSVSDPTVINEGGLYRMWYTGTTQNADGSRGTTAIGYATSRDGINWVRAQGQPVFQAQKPWGSGGIGGPSIIPVQRDLLYELWFHGADEDGNLAVGRAYSDDGIRWVEDDQNPLVRDDNFGFTSPDVHKVGSTYYLWLNRLEDARAESSLVHFTIWPLAIDDDTAAALPNTVPQLAE
jgi:hypothetical protein